MLSRKRHADIIRSDGFSLSISWRERTGAKKPGVRVCCLPGLSSTTNATRWAYPNSWEITVEVAEAPYEAIRDRLGIEEITRSVSPFRLDLNSRTLRYVSEA